MDSVHDKNSTIVRKSPRRRADADWRLAAMRACMRMAGWVSPALAARLMARLWFTAPQTRPKPAALARLETGQRHDVDVDGNRVAVWSWGNGPAVLLMHGWGGNAGQMHAFVAPLCAAGLRVLAFDAPAHGSSGPSHWGGRRVSFVEIAAAIGKVTAGVDPLVGLVAHSGGCTAATLALREGLGMPARLAFIAPFARPQEAIAPFARALGADARALARFEADVQQRLGRRWPAFDVTGLPQVKPVGRLLVVHDRDDREVVHAQGAAVAASWPGARLHTTQGLGHRRLLEDPAVVTQVVAFIAADERGTV